jgi:hypothetical protein
MIMELSVSEIIGLGALLLSVLGALATIIGHLWKRILHNSKELSDFKLYVAQRYASFNAISDLERKVLASENRLIISINNLTERIDRILTRLDR